MANDGPLDPLNVLLQEAVDHLPSKYESSNGANAVIVGGLTVTPPGMRAYSLLVHTALSSLGRCYPCNGIVTDTPSTRLRVLRY